MSAAPLPSDPWLGLPGVTAEPIGGAAPAAPLAAPLSAAELRRRNEAAAQLVTALAVGLAGALVVLAWKRRR